MTLSLTVGVLGTWLKKALKFVPGVDLNVAKVDIARHGAKYFWMYLSTSTSTT